MSKPEISRILTLSTGHVTECTRNMLLRESEENNFGLDVYEKDDFGFIIYLPAPVETRGVDTPYTETPAGCTRFGISYSVPKDLQDVLRYCHDMGCNILCLDADGPEIPYLRYYGDDEDYEAPEEVFLTPLYKTDLPVSLAHPLANYFGDWHPIGKILEHRDEQIHEKTGLTYRQIAKVREFCTKLFSGEEDGDGRT